MNYEQFQDIVRANFPKTKGGFAYRNKELGEFGFYTKTFEIVFSNVDLNMNLYPWTIDLYGEHGMMCSGDTLQMAVEDLVILTGVTIA
jgi:hypothetical protein